MKTAISANAIAIPTNDDLTTNARLDYIAVKNVAMIIRAINHKMRQQIIKLLKENKRMNVTDIYVKLHLEQPVASQHLAILRRANIVISERDGKLIHYALNDERISAIATFTDEIVSSPENGILEDDGILKKVKKDINDLRRLQENWDDEGASPIEKAQIENALLFVNDQYKSSSIVPSFIAPTLDAGVLVEFANHNKRIDIRFENRHPFMTIFESGKLLYNGNLDQTKFTRHIAK